MMASYQTITRSLKSIIYIGALCFLTGCASTAETVKPAEPQIVDSPETHKIAAKVEQKTVTKNTDIPEQPAESGTPEAEEIIEEKGVIFAKSVFEGVLQTPYVQLHIQGKGENAHQFELIIGEKDRQSALPWDVKKVEPGYFHVELPAGSYSITSVSIPVGSTLAEEPISIDFDVLADEVTYVGTLKINGTKEKIKLGGLPVIRPGFEYEAQVLDERVDGFQSMRKILADYEKEFQVQLLQINSIPQAVPATP